MFSKASLVIVVNCGASNNPTPATNAKTIISISSKPVEASNLIPNAFNKLSPSANINSRNGIKFKILNFKDVKEIGTLAQDVEELGVNEWF